MRAGITGCKGRMGQTLIREILAGAQPGLEIAGGSEREGVDLSGVPGYATHNTEDLFINSDVVIDFTIPEATRRHIWLAAKHKKPLIIGTTGLTATDEKEIRDASKECAIVYAANMSVGVNILLALVEQAAARLGPEWDIEISDIHHKHKIDAPSGTALALGKAAAAGRKVAHDDKKIIDRTGKRKEGDIGYAVQRGGDIVGEHTVTFYGPGERIELAHKATDRALFARGALRAALWTAKKPHGLYSMKDVLGL